MKENDIAFPVHNAVMVLQEVLLMAAVGSLGDAIDLLTRVGFAGGESAAGGSASAAAGTPPSLAAALTALSESIRRRELLVMCMPARPVYTEWATLSLFPHSSAVTLWCGCVGVPPPPPTVWRRRHLRWRAVGAEPPD